MSCSGGLNQQRLSSLHIPIHSHASTRTHTCKHICTHALTHSHTYTHARIHTHTQATPMALWGGEKKVISCLQNATLSPNKTTLLVGNHKCVLRVRIPRTKFLGSLACQGLIQYRHKEFNIVICFMFVCNACYYSSKRKKTTFA